MMKYFFMILFVLCALCTELHSQVAVADSSFAIHRDSIPVMRNSGITPTAVALTTLKVTGQVACGLLGGVIGVSMLDAHPVAAGIGGILGSSYAVYLIGDIGNDGRGQYRWVLAAGAINGILYTPVFLNNQHSGFGVIGVVGLAVVTTVTSEIITFYATQKDSDPKVDIGMTMLPSGKNHAYIPGIHIGMNF